MTIMNYKTLTSESLSGYRTYHVSVKGRTSSNSNDENLVPDLGEIIYTGDSIRTAAPAQQEIFHPDSMVSGTVIEAQEQKVICDIELSSGHHVEVNLPLTIFPMAIEFGTPFSLSMDSTSGFRKPKIVHRQINPQEFSKENIEIQALIDEL